ncbi:MAG TPA: glutamate racemase [Acidimicrobiales bacterium]|nr:glutamate racemase [Acidimicrobiales bacterium]
MDDRPIGVFDSGFGGLTVARALIDLLPGEDLVYVGDTGRYPYGPRPLDEVRAFARQITRKLVEQDNVKLVVVACNNATAAALGNLRYEFDVPIVGVINAGVRALLAVTRTGRVGVVGTEGTISSGAYQGAVMDSRRAWRGGRRVQLTCAACPGFVELVERGEPRGSRATQLAERLLAPLRSAGVDSLLLGCTHYPYLARTIGEVMGPEVVLVSSADETAFEVRSILLETGLGRRSRAAGCHRWFSSGEVGSFVSIGQHLFGQELDRAEHWEPPSLGADSAALGSGRAGRDGRTGRTGRGASRWSLHHSYGSSDHSSSATISRAVPQAPVLGVKKSTGRDSGAYVAKSATGRLSGNGERVLPADYKE